MKCAIYNRISADNAGDSHGVIQHEAECRRLAEQLGWNVVADFTDNDISAHSGKVRPGYKALMKAISCGEVEAIVTRDLDRMHRKSSEFEGFITACLDNDILVHSVLSGHLDLVTAAGRMTARVLAAVAQHEVEHMIERQKASHIHRATQGKYRGGRRPFGFEPDGVTLNQAEADAIKEGSRMILSGSSTGSVVKMWNESGVLTPSGNRWGVSTARRVLQRPRNAGLSVHRGEIVGRAQWPVIVPEDDWRGVCAVISRPMVKWGREDSVRKWIGSGIYICGVCGNKLQVNSSSRGVRQYRCVEAHLSRGLDPLDEYVTEIVLGRIRQLDVLAKPVGGVDVQALHRTRTGLELRLQELSVLFAEGAIDSSQLAGGTKVLREKIAAIENDIAQSRIVSPIADLAIHNDTEERWQELGPEAKGNIVKALLEVTVLPVPRAHRNKPFNPDFIRVEWRTA